MVTFTQPKQNMKLNKILTMCAVAAALGLSAGSALAQGGLGARAETFVRAFELLEHVQARTLVGLRL